MARTPFAVQIKPAAMGATTYTVPAGKFAVCNFFLQLDAGSYATSSGPLILLNGIQVTKLPAGNSGRAFGRKGPFVFNAGDVIANGGMGSYDVSSPPIAFGMVGFLYDLSTRKVPLNQKLITGTTSYTVPSGKHMAAMLYPGDRVDGGPGSYQLNVLINSVLVMKLGTQMPGTFAADYGFGPLTVGSASVLSITVVNVATPPQMALLTGFIYNN